MLAAGRAAAPDVYYYTMIHYTLTYDSPDVRVTARLLGRLGLEHHVIHTPGELFRARARDAALALAIRTRLDRAARRLYRLVE